MNVVHTHMNICETEKLNGFGCVRTHRERKSKSESERHQWECDFGVGKTDIVYYIYAYTSRYTYDT